MALTFTQDAPWTGPRCKDHGRIWDGLITLDGQYPTGGWVLTPANFGFANNIDSLISETSNGTYSFGTTTATGLLKAFVTSTGAEVGASASGVSGVILRVRAEGY